MNALAVGDITIQPVFDGTAILETSMFAGSDWTDHQHLLADDGRLHVPVGALGNYHLGRGRPGGTVPIAPNGPALGRGRPGDTVPIAPNGPGRVARRSRHRADRPQWTRSGGPALTSRRVGVADYGATRWVNSVD